MMDNLRFKSGVTSCQVGLLEFVKGVLCLVNGWAGSRLLHHLVILLDLFLERHSFAGRPTRLFIRQLILPIELTLYNVLAGSWEITTVLGFPSDL